MWENKVEFIFSIVNKGIVSILAILFIVLNGFIRKEEKIKYVCIYIQLEAFVVLIEKFTFFRFFLVRISELDIHVNL